MTTGGHSDALTMLAQRLSMRSPLSRAETQAVLALPTEAISVQANREIVRAGERMEHSCLLEDGLVAWFEQLEDGRRQIISLHVPGDLFDLYSLLIPQAPAPLVALAPSTVVRISHKALRALTDEWPDLATALWRDTVADANMIAQAVVRLGRRDAFARVAHLLCEMAIRYGAIAPLKDAAFRFPITQEHLADVVGLTSVHVNRTLRSLREARLVTFTAGRVKILDWPGLQRAAGFDPTYLCVAEPARLKGLVA